MSLKTSSRRNQWELFGNASYPNWTESSLSVWSLINLDLNLDIDQRGANKTNKTGFQNLGSQY